MRSIRKQISNAQPGSDIHGLKEKIAYQYHLIDPSRSAEVNWFRAERDLEGWCLSAESNWFRAERDLEGWYFYQYGKYEFRKPVEFFFHRLLEKYAHGGSEYRFFWSKGGSSFDDWMYAQNKLAEQIMHQVNIF